MTDDPIQEEAGVKFCPNCGHEGNDELCPICNEKMESLKEEVDRVADLEKEKDVTETDDDLSLEEVASKEEAGDAV